MCICYDKAMCVCLSAEWRALEHFHSLCNTLPCHHHLIIDKLKTVPQLIKDEGEQLSKLITSSSTDVTKINEKIITYLILKLCYSGSGNSLVRLCDVMDELIDPTETPICVQQIRHGTCVCMCVYVCVYKHMYVCLIYITYSNCQCTVAM